MRECKQAFTLFFLFSRVFFGRARTLLYLLCKFDGVKSSNLLSRPTRGAWIEITPLRFEEWRRRGRAPHGARGLKYNDLSTVDAGRQSRPTRGAWIEIKGETPSLFILLSRPTRGAWIEIFDVPP